MILSTAVVAIMWTWAIHYGRGEALRDHAIIEAEGVIHHTEAWLFRALITGCILLLIALPASLLGIMYGWSFLCPYISCGALFSAVFRIRLNGLRGKEWDYVSRSNYYDRFWLFLARQDVSSAGRIATGAEGVAALAAAIMFVVLL